MGNWPGWNFPTTYILNIRCNGRDNTEEQKTFLTQKHHLNNCWTGEKISFSFVVPIQPLVVMRTSYYTCNVIRDVNQWFWICGLKVNLFFDNHVVIITYWLEKMLRKFTFLKYSFFFWKSTVTVNLKKFSSSSIFRWHTFGKFCIVKFNYFRGRYNTVKETLKYFWFTTMLVILKTKALLTY